jgi:flagellar motility protein MotE (MotC chaperone)
MRRTLSLFLVLSCLCTVSGITHAQETGAQAKPEGKSKPKAAATTHEKPTPALRKKGNMAGQRTLVDSLDEKVPLEVGIQLRIFRQARQRRSEIDRMEGELERRSARLKSLIDEVELRYKTLRMVQDELSAGLAEAQEPAGEEAEQTDIDAKKERLEKVGRLAKVFDKMKAEDAAKMIPSMELPLVVSVIERIKPKQSAKILSKIDPQKAAEITGMMTATKSGKKRGTRP